MMERLPAADAADVRARRKRLRIPQEDFGLIAAVQSSSIGQLERGALVPPATITRVLAALAALEAGASRERAREIATEAAPLNLGRKGGIHARKYDAQRPLRTPDVEPFPPDCFAGMDVRTRANGRIGLAEPALTREAMS